MKASLGGNPVVGCGGKLAAFLLWRLLAGSEANNYNSVGWVDATGTLRGYSAPAPPAPAPAPLPSSSIGLVDYLEIAIIVGILVGYCGLFAKYGRHAEEGSLVHDYFFCWGALSKGRGAFPVLVLLSPILLPLHAIRIYVGHCLHIYLRRAYWSALGGCHSFYTDPQFPPDARSLGAVGGDKADKNFASKATANDDIAWVRAQNFSKPNFLEADGRPCLHKTKMCLFEGKIEAADILQGQLGDCWLMAAMACLAEHEGAIPALFWDPEINPAGRYCVRLFDPQEKRWRDIVIDDYIPCKKPSRYDPFGKNQNIVGAAAPQPLYAQPHGQEIWVMILEKAFAKLCGSYANIEAGFTEWGIMCMTGGSAWRYKKSAQSGTWTRINMESVPDEKDKRAAGFRATDEVVNNKDLFDLIRHYHRNGAVLCCSGAEAAGEASGLVAGHAFSLLQVRTVAVGVSSYIRMVQVRNPWGHKEWTGAWSDKSSHWKEYPQVAEALAYKDDDDGSFWMQWEDFVTYWSNIGVIDCDTNILTMRPPLHEESTAAGPTVACLNGCGRFWCCCAGLRRLLVGHEASDRSLKRREYMSACGLDVTGCYCRVLEQDAFHASSPANGSGGGHLSPTTANFQQSPSKMER